MEAVFKHLSTSLQRELDFRQEADNIGRMQGVLADYHRLAVAGGAPGSVHVPIIGDGRDPRHPDQAGAGRFQSA